MLEKDIKVGGLYVANVSGVKTVVRLEAVRVVPGFTGRRAGKQFAVTNLRTGRRTAFRSAAKLQREATAQEVANAGKGIAPKPVRPFRPVGDPNCDHEFPDARYGEDGRVANSVKCVKCGAIPTPSWFVDQREKSGVRLTDEGRTAILNDEPKPPEAEQRRPFSAPAAVAAPSKDASASSTTRTMPSCLTPSSVTATAACPATSRPTLAAKLAEAARPPVVDTAPHLIVEARAGTGKTTTLISALQRLKGIEPRAGNGAPMVPSPQQAAVWDAVCKSPRDASVAFVAFNKSIATELQQRVPAGCAAMTMHSLGFRAVQKALGRLEPTEWAAQDLIASLGGFGDARAMRKQAPVLLKAAEQLVSLCKMNLVGAAGPATDDDLDALAGHYDVDLDRYRRQAFDLVPRVLEAARDPKGRITYDDMTWLPVVLGLPVPQTDLLLVDERQDLNKCQQRLAMLAGRRIVAVGDERQSIMGFAGADAEACANLAQSLRETGRGVETLSLTVTRRCGKAIVEEARRWVPDFEAHESNPAGLVRQAAYPWRKRADGGTEALPWASTYAAEVRPGDMVLCRTNAPLVTNCFALIKRGVKANIQGRDVGRGLVSLVEKLVKGETLPTPALVGRLSDWLAAETDKEQAKRNPSETRLTGLADRYSCLLAFTEGAADSGEVVGKIGQVFTDDKASPGVKLSSIHRAKGLEADRVFWLQPPNGGMREDKMKAWERQQQRNLEYVAVTRAIHELIYVT